MKTQRKVAYSIRYRLTTIFQDASLWGGISYTVYNRSDWSPTFDKPRPFIFVVDESLASGFRIEHPPIVIVELDRDQIIIGLGGESAAAMQVALHIFARDRGERRDVQDAIIENFLVSVGGNSVPGFTLYDLNTMGTPSVYATTSLIPTEGRYWTQGNITASPFAPYDPSGQVEGLSACILSTAFVVPSY